MQMPKTTAGKVTTPRGDFGKQAAEQPAEQKKFNDDDDFDDDFDDDSLDDLDYDGGSRYEEEDDDDF